MLSSLNSVLMCFLLVTSLVTPSRAGSLIVGHRASAALREREGARNEQLYRNLSAIRSRDPARFDDAHPFFGQLLGDPEFFTRYHERWQAHPLRFQHYHPFAWRILDGGDRLGWPTTGGEGSIVTPQPPPLPGTSEPPLPPVFPPTPPTPPLPPPTPGPLPPAVVPEPSSLVLIVSSLGAMLLARAACRLRRN
jgi:hypothetical protein